MYRVNKCLGADKQHSRSNPNPTTALESPPPRFTASADRQRTRLTFVTWELRAAGFLQPNSKQPYLCYVHKLWIRKIGNRGSIRRWTGRGRKVENRARANS